MFGIFSLLRAFQRNWQVLCISVLVLASVLWLGTFFFVRGSMLMENELKDKLRTTAAVAAMQFDPKVIGSISGKSSMQTPAFRDVVERLKRTRQTIPNIRFAYIMRKTADANTLEFVADADSLATEKELDVNHNGLVEPDEEGSYPGDPYDISEIPAMQGPAFEGAAVDDNFTHDQWGILITGYAPIRDASGKPVAVLGMDMVANDYIALSRRIFSPVAFLLLCVVALILASFIAFFLRSRRIEVLKRVNRERSGLLLLAMHQIGSPLTIIRWSLEELKDQMESGSLKQAVTDHAKYADQAIEQLTGILDELKEASQVDTGTLEYHGEWTSLKDIIAGVMPTLQPELRRRKQTITQDVDPTLGLSLDRKLIAGVLRELLINAMTFSHDGASVTITAKHGGKCVLVEIADHGCGMPKKDIPRMFEKFTRGTNAHLYQPNGNGLGLYIAKGIIERAGGEIWIKSTEAQGTTVTFTLPC